MAYRPPNSYAKFIRTASPVATPGASRIMALIGTGVNYYTVYNETITRNINKPYDTLANENVFEVISVSSRPVYASRNNPENVYYEQGVDWELKDGQNIVWRTLTDDIVQPKLVNVDTDPYINEGSREFEKQCTYTVDANNYYFVKDGQWKIEVTFANKEMGCYRIIDVATNEIIGEYVCGDTVNTAIPGINLKVASTFKRPSGSSVESDDNKISIGDYFIIETTAAKTEVEASAKIDTATSVQGFKNSVDSMEIINSGLVVDGTFKVRFINAASKQFQVFSVNTETGAETLIYPDTEDATIYATWIKGDELYDIIPGVELIMNDLKYTPEDNDALTIVTTARQVDDTIPGESDTYYVTYKYKKSSAGYEAQIFFDYDDIVAEYGNYEVTASGYVTNSLSLGAEIAFTNGIGQIICVQAKSNGDVEFCDAIDKLKKPLPGVSNVNTIVPLTTSRTVGSYLRNHIDIMSSYEVGKERMGYLGAYPGQPMTKKPSGDDRSMGIIETCEGFYNERIVYVAPGRVIKQIRDINTGVTHARPLPGCYLAVGVASIGLFNDPAEPLTRKRVAGFDYLPDSYMEAEMNLIAGSGCTLLVNEGSDIMIRHGITTEPTEVNSMEITCIQIKDFVIDAVRTTLGKLYIGRKNLPSVVSDVQYTVTSILSQFINQEIIESFQGLKVKRSTLDPRAILVSFQIMAIYGVTYIDIEFSFSTIG